jgi:hypothetical protein
MTMAIRTGRKWRHDAPSIYFSSGKIPPPVVSLKDALEDCAIHVLFRPVGKYKIGIKVDQSMNAFF